MPSHRPTAEELLDAQLASARKLRVDALLDRYREFTGLYATGPIGPARPLPAEGPRPCSRAWALRPPGLTCCRPSWAAPRWPP
jgi:hypothetical protein